jgi:hypothetical protein
MKSYLHLICALECKGGGGQILNFQNTFDRAYDEIMMEIQTENFLRSIISMRLDTTITSTADL